MVIEILTTTKLTNDMAFNEMFHIHINPPILISINVTIINITNAAITSKPVSMNETVNMLINEMLRDVIVSVQIVKYCS